MRRRGALAALLALAAGCGAGSDPAPAGGPDELTVRHLREDEVLRSIRLDCAGADRAICRRAAEVLPSLRPIAGEFCTEVYGGPWRIALDGRLGGRSVAAAIGRRDGCAIARYERLARALGRAAPPHRPGVSAAG